MEAQSTGGQTATREVRNLLQAAMAIFLVTVVIGILNGLDLMEFSRQVLLTHLHAGTLGWITLGVFAAAFQIFRSEGEATSPTRWLGPLAIASVAFYVVAFYTTFGIVRPLAGTALFLVILGVTAWVVSQGRKSTYTIPRLAVVGALINLIVGGVFGILLGIQISGTDLGLPPDIYTAHAGAMIGGYVILAGMAIIEWKLVPDPKPARQNRGGIVQITLMFLGGLIFAVGAILGSLELMTINVPLMIVGVIIFLVRMGPKALKQPWSAGSSGRLYAISVPFLVINVSLLAYLITLLVQAEGDITAVPRGLALAMDHALFIGVMANSIFGMIYDVSEAQRAYWRRAEHLMFWGINVGLVGFLVGLILEMVLLKRIFTPIMGVGILIAQATYTIRMYRDRQGVTPTGVSPVAPFGG